MPHRIRNPHLLQKRMSAAEAAALIQPGDTVAMREKRGHFPDDSLLAAGFLALGLVINARI